MEEVLIEVEVGSETVGSPLLLNVVVGDPAHGGVIMGGDRPVVVQGVQHLFHPPELLDAWPGSERNSRIVFITRDVERSAVEQTFRALLQ